MKRSSSRWATGVIGLGLLSGLVACGDMSQAMTGMPKSDTAASAGTGVNAFTAPGWQSGDVKSWGEQLKTRAQYGQNDHTRSP